MPLPLKREATMSFKKTLLAIAFALTAVAPAIAAGQGGTPAQAEQVANPERGWFFFETKPTEAEPPKEEAPPPQKMPTTLPPPPKEDKCKKKETWSAACGFVDPGKDFEFQGKQRDELLQNMVMSKNDPKAVEAFQYYMRWVLERTTEVTNLWWYNMVQNPDLDPTVSSPVSTLGLRLMTDVHNGQQKEIFDLVKDEGGMYVFFSRSDCMFCHQMASPLQQLSHKTGLPVRNASLDGKCIEGLEAGCMTAPATLAPADALQVTTVPTVFLYTKPNTWIRIATGVTDTDSMITRTAQFFSAYRTAMLKGVENGQNGRASVDFSANEASGASKGVAGDGTGKIRVPTEQEISTMLGKSK